MCCVTVQVLELRALVMIGYSACVVLPCMIFQLSALVMVWLLLHYLPVECIGDSLGTRSLSSSECIGDGLVTRALSSS